MREAPARLDAANIALLPGRLSFNALLFRNNAAQNRAVLADQQRPQSWMLPAAQDVESFFLRHGARRVHWMPELYVRSADQIAHPLRPEPLVPAGPTHLAVLGPAGGFGSAGCAAWLVTGCPCLGRTGRALSPAVHGGG